ncbi:MAG: hypothetical protein WHV44_05805 [Anaerolineales bacterium]
MSETDYRPGEQVEIKLDSDFWGNVGWLPGVVLRLEPYSQHRSFIWVQVHDAAARQAFGRPMGPIAVLNPRNIRKAATGLHL